MHKPFAAINSVAIPIETVHNSRTVTSPSIFVQQLNSISSSGQQRERQQNKGVAERLISWFRGKQPEHEQQPLFHDGREMSLMTTQTVQQPEGFRCGVSHWLGGVMSLLVLSATIGGVVYGVRTYPAYNNSSMTLSHGSLIPFPQAEALVDNSTSPATVSSRISIPDCEDFNSRHLCSQLNTTGQTRVKMGGEYCYCPTTQITNTAIGSTETQSSTTGSTKAESTTTGCTQTESTTKNKPTGCKSRARAYQTRPCSTRKGPPENGVTVDSNASITRNAVKAMLKTNSLSRAIDRNDETNLEKEYQDINNWVGNATDEEIKVVYRRLTNQYSYKLR
ncbi:hypothetical protein ACQYRI_02590 [Salmonella enterica]